MLHGKMELSVLINWLQERWFWSIQRGPMSSQGPLKMAEQSVVQWRNVRKIWSATTDLPLTRWEGGRSHWRWEKPQAQECRQPLEDGKDKNKTRKQNKQTEKKGCPPRTSREEHSPANTLILAKWDPFQTSDLQNCEIIYLCCFRPRLC